MKNVTAEELIYCGYGCLNSVLTAINKEGNKRQQDKNNDNSNTKYTIETGGNPIEQVKIYKYLG